MSNKFEALRGKVDNIVTKLGNFHWEIGYYQQVPGEIIKSTDPSRVKFHYRPWGAIAHEEDAMGRFHGRREVSSAKELIEALGLIVKTQ